MRVLLKRKKTKGFTLVELVVVMSIIAILVLALTPKTVGYIKEGKKTQALSQVRQVVVAVEAYNITEKDGIGDDVTFKDIKKKLSGSDYVDIAKVKTVNDEMKYSQMKEMINGGAEFELEDGVITSVNGEKVNSSSTS